MAKIKKIKKGHVDQYNEMVSINKIMKNICGYYFIHYTGQILMKSINDRFEKIVMINNVIDICEYIGYSMLPNNIFEFTKKIKKSSLDISSDDELNLYFKDKNQEDLDALVLHQNYPPKIINKIKNLYYSDIYIDCHDDIKKHIDIFNTNVESCYNHYDKFAEMFNNKQRKFINIPNNIKDSLCDGKAVTFITDDNIQMDLTIQIFNTLKSADELYYYISPIFDKDNPKKIYVIFKEIHDNMTIYTLCAIYRFS